MPGVCVPYNRRSNCKGISRETALWTGTLQTPIRTKTENRELSLSPGGGIAMPMADACPTPACRFTCRLPAAGMGGMAGRVYQPVAGRRAFGKNYFSLGGQGLKITPLVVFPSTSIFSGS